MKESLSPATQKSVDYVLSVHRRSRAHFSKSTLAKLASEAGVSLVTMWRAVSHLKAQGIVSSVPGRGTIIGVAPELPAQAGGGSGRKLTPDRLIWQHVHTRIRRDILRGVFKPGQLLPSKKELRYRYRISSPTLKKCLDSLMEQGLLIASWKTMAIPLPASVHQTSRLVLLLDIERELSTDRQRELLRAVEMACRKTGTALDMIRYEWRRGTLHLYSHPGGAPCALRDGDDVLGYLVWSHRGASVPEMLIRRVLPFRKPVSLLDEVEFRDYPKRIVSDRNLQIFRMATSMQSSIEVARYLLSMGHSRIAYVSPFHGADWSRQRLAGLVKTYREAGYPGGVVAVTVDGTASQFEYYAPAAERFHIDQLVKSFASWARSHASELMDRFEPYLIKYIKDECAFAEMNMRLRPLLDRATRDRSISAWVAAEDRTAEFIAGFHQQGGFRIGSTAPLVSFDDSYRATEQYLTSYNFNVSTVAEAMIRHVLNPASFRQLTREKYIEIPGIIIERQSTMRARRHLQGR